MPAPNDPSPAGNLNAARDALEKGDLAGALRQVASALSEDPNRSEALSLLEEIIAAAPDALELIPDDDLPTPSSLKAVHAYILAGQGQVPEAIDKLLDVIGERPDVLYIDWLLGWLARPEAAGKLDMERLVGFIGGLLEQFAALTAPHGGGRETLTRMPMFIQLVRRTQPAEPHFLTAGVALLCRLGYLDEALKLAREAHSLEPGLQTTIALAGTHATRNELDQALAAYRKAIELEPTDVSARLNMADLLVHHGRLPEAEEIYAEVLDREPEQEVARPSYCFLRFVTSGEESWRDQLLDLGEAEPDNERAQRLVQRVTPYVGYLPDPPDVTARLQRPAGQQGADAPRSPRSAPDDESSANNKFWLPFLEAPSNYLAFDWLNRLELTVVRVQKPDPRLPRGPAEYLLWAYDDTRPRPAVAPPAPEVAQAVADLASQPYSLDVWWSQARRLAHELGSDPLPDLLATMVYPPRVTFVDRPALWVYHVQLAAALVIAHLDGGWRDSLRRKALLSVAYGPADWTVDAALVALAAIARDDEDACADITRLFRELRKNLPADGTVCWFPALMWCSLRLPDVSDDERAELRDKLRRWQDDRKAERHYRQAQAHAEKGEYDRAIEELTRTVELAPGNAEAFRERAALYLRRGDPLRAVTDFTQAIQLQPGTAADHMGRGQAHLRQGRFDDAIGDFTATTRLTPWDWQPWYRRGLAHAARKEHERAIADFSEAIRLSPDRPDGYLQRAVAYSQLGQLAEAIGDCTAQIKLNPRSALAYNSRARLHYRQGNHGAAIADHLRAAELDPGNANTHSQLAWIWATCPDASARDGKRALDAATKACDMTKWKTAHCLDTLAAAHAENGRFDEAVQWSQRAVELAADAEKATYLRRLEMYRQGRAWREG